MSTTRLLGGPDRLLDDSEVAGLVETYVRGIDLDGRSVCVVVPDATRRCPLPLLLSSVEQAIGRRARTTTVVVALGTHAPMSEADVSTMVGPTALPVVNHAWWDDRTFAHVGTIDADTVSNLSGGRLVERVEIRVNRLVAESDVTLILGPVLPHEVVGFSGGHKYLYPGLSGQELIDLTHWLGALITSREIIGTRGLTPVRAVIEAAAALTPGERHAVCVVTDRRSDRLHAVACGDPLDAWDRAAAVAQRTHVVHLDRPVQRVLSMVAPRYRDLWTGAKGFYKVEPVVADGGEVVLLAPHITEVATTHPGLVDIGYHCRDRFLADWDRFSGLPRGELAHSTHLFGAGSYDPSTGIEHQRVTVTLATAIPPEVVAHVGLNAVDPATVDVAGWASDPDALVVPDAGEVLYRLR